MSHSEWMTLPPQGARVNRPEAQGVPAPEAAPPALRPVRIPEPMAVHWQGVEHAVAAWDVNGFELATPLPRVLAPGRGRVVDVTLLIGRGGTRIEMQVQARATDPDTRNPQAFAFVDLDRAQAEVLHRIVDQVVANKALSLTQLLNDTETTRAARTATETRARGMRTAFQLGLAATVLAVAGTLTWNSFANVRARYAAVTVPATTVAVPVAGVIAGVRAEAGQQVAAGDVLGHVRPADHDARLDDLDTRRRALEAEQAEWRARLATLGTVADLSTQGAESQLAQLDDALRLAERRLAVERAELATLNAQGLPTPARQRDRARQEAEVLRAETALLDLRTRRDAAARAGMLAPLGLGLEGARGDGTTVEIAELRLAGLAAEIAALYAREERIAAGEPVLAPCDCTVHRIDLSPGEYARPDRAAAVLIGDAPAAIHALIPAEDARKIDLGDRARIELADGTRLQGRVAQMNFEARWPGHAGLPQDVFAAERYARVAIAPGAPIDAPAGMAAHVVIRTGGPLSGLAALVGR